MYIDTDTHHWPIRFLERVQHPGRGHLEIEGDRAHYYRGGEYIQSFSEGRWNLQIREQVMDQEGFDAQVLIPDNRHLLYELEPDLGRASAIAHNDTTAEEVAGNPRFIGLVWVYLPDVDHAVREVRRGVEELGLKGVKLAGGWDDVQLDDPRLYPFYEEVARLDVPILVHPAGNTHTSRTDTIQTWMVGTDSFRPMYELLTILGLPFTYMTAIARLIFSGTLDRFPTLRFAFFEGSVGWVPFMMTRMQQSLAGSRKSIGTGDILYQAAEARGHLPRPIRDYFSQIYLAASSWEAYLARICELWPDHNIMIGSDYNHTDSSSTWPNTVRMVKSIPGLSNADRDRILGGNAMRLFKMGD